MISKSLSLSKFFTDNYFWRHLWITLPFVTFAGCVWAWASDLPVGIPEIVVFAAIVSITSSISSVFLRGSEILKFTSRMRSFFETAEEMGIVPGDYKSSSGHSLVHTARNLKVMGVRLRERLRSETKERNQLEVLLTSMAEGVIAVDENERIIRINRAACDLCDIAIVRPENRSIEEVFRNAEMLRFIRSALSSGSPIDAEISVPGTSPHHIMATAHPMRTDDSGKQGIVIVLSDITRLRQLERMRQDFVANASHELKTPITSIKGFVETLLEGALETPNARRFLEIVARHVERLTNIVNDLLDLALLEQYNERGMVELREANVLPVLESAVEACRYKADAKHVEIEIDCEPDLTAELNDNLLEQALVNLVDNAIKYSEAESIVRIEAKKLERSVLLQVRDSGCGIQSSHLPRLFERFYRVDQARSRSLGGTGLGLSIVKHIAQGHGGSVSVESTPGSGSVFTISLQRGLHRQNSVIENFN